MKRNSLTNFLVCIVFVMLIFVPTIVSADDYGDWYYSVNADGESATLTGYIGTITSTTNFSIPNVIGNPSLKVTAVSEDVKFGKAKTLKIPGNLTDISIKSIQKIDVEDSEYNLESIIVLDDDDNSNEKYVSNDGVLYEKDEDDNVTKLVCYPADKDDTLSYTDPAVDSDFPDSTEFTEIGEYAFYKSQLIKIELPDTITDIGTYAFDMSSIMYLDFGTSITSLPQKQLFTVEDEASLHLVIGNNVESINKDLITCSDDNKSIYIYGTAITPANIYAANNGYNFLKGSSIDNDGFITDTQSNTLLGYFGNIEADADPVTVPEEIVNIDADFAKSLAKEITNITLADTVVNIDVEATKGLAELTEYNVAVGTGNHFSAVDGILYNYNATPTEIVAYPQKKSGTEFTSATNSITSIEDYAFYNNQYLADVTLGSTITSIEEYAFYGCQALDSVTLSTDSTYEYIEEGTFSECIELNSITIPYTIKSIGVNAFMNDIDLAVLGFGVNGSDGIEFIHYGAFDGCTKISEIDLPDSIKFVDGYAFSSVDSDFTFSLPEEGTETWVQSYVEETQIVSPKTGLKFWMLDDDGNVIYKSYALASDSTIYNGGFVYDTTINKIIKYVGHLDEETVPTAFTGNTADEIAKYAFYACDTLDTLTIPAGFASISDNMAAYSGITSIVLGENVDSIGYRAFFACPLSSIDMSACEDNLNYIGAEAFDIFEVSDAVSSVDLPDDNITWYSNLGKEATSIDSSNCDNFFYNENKGAEVLYNLDSIESNDSLNPDRLIADNGNISLRYAWCTEKLFKGWFSIDNDSSEENRVLYVNSTNNSVYPYFEDVDDGVITYYLDGGNNNNANPLSYEVDGGNITLEEPYKDGYDFVGWFDDENQEVTVISDDSADDIELTAQWGEAYNIVYNNLPEGSTNDPDNPSVFSINTESPIVLGNAERSGYVFGGWYDSADERVTTIDTSTENDITLTALWYKEYNIYYTLNGDGVTNSNEDKFNASMNNFSLADAGYPDDTKEFVGWYDENDNEVSTIDTSTEEDIFLSAVWEDAATSGTTYTIKYNLNSGANNDSNPDTFTSSDLPVTLEDPVRSGYTFDGWYTDSGFTEGNKITQITTAADEEIWAKWTAVEEGTYTITYFLNGGAQNASNPATYTAASATITLADPTRSGYTFGGWYTDASFTDANKVTQIVTGSTGNKILYAEWILDSNTHKITYVLNGGTQNPSNPDTFTESTATITLASPTRSGYSFAGWYSDASFTEANKVTQIVQGTTTDITLYAKWSQSFTLTYNANGGSGSASVTKSAGSTFNLYDGGEFVRSGYLLDGWAHSSSETTPDYLLGGLFTMPAENETLYAVWVADSDNDGISDADENAMGTDPNDDDDKPKTVDISGKVVDSSGNPIVGAIVILNSDPETTTTNASGIYEFDGVSLSPHMLTITNDGVTLGIYKLNFKKGSTNSYSVSDSGSTDSLGVIDITVTGESLNVEVDIKQNASGEWQISDVDLKDSSGNDLPATATNNYLLLVISLVVIVGAAVGVALLIRKMRNNN